METARSNALQVALTELRSLLYWVLDYLRVVGFESGNGWTNEVRTVLTPNSVSLLARCCARRDVSRSPG